MANDTFQALAGGASRVYENDGSAAFTDFPGSPLAFEGQDAELVDLDGDGDLDAFLADRDGDRLLLGDGAGGFTPGALPVPTQSDRVDLGGPRRRRRRRPAAVAGGGGCAPS